MKIKVKKTKVMDISRKLKIFIDTQEVEHVKQFKYLGSVINENEYCDQDIKSRMAMEKKAKKINNQTIRNLLSLPLYK